MVGRFCTAKHIEAFAVENQGRHQILGLVKGRELRPLVLDDVELFARCSVLVVGDAAHYKDFICIVIDDATGVGPTLLHW